MMIGGKFMVQKILVLNGLQKCIVLIDPLEHMYTRLCFLSSEAR